MLLSDETSNFPYFPSTPLIRELSLIKKEKSPTSGHEVRLVPSDWEILIVMSGEKSPSGGKVIKSGSLEQLTIKNRNDSRIIFFMVRELKVNKYEMIF